MKLIEYLDKKGTFDYELYKKVQQDGNKRKIEHVWVSEQVVQKLSAFLKANVQNLQSGLCHGTRRGKEQEWFSKYTGADFLGTEISETATQFPNTIQWDFHDTRPEWIGKIDAIYSNSWDHSYDPSKCFRSWMACLSPGGILLLEHTAFHNDEHVGRLDPFGIMLDELLLFLTEIGRGEFNVVAVLRDMTKDRKLSKIDLTTVAVQRRSNPIDLTTWR